MEFVNENLTYRDVFEFDIDLMNYILNKYEDSEKAWKVFYEFYKDPDGSLWNLTSIKLSMV